MAASLGKVTVDVEVVLGQGPPAVGRTVHYVARGSADGRYPSACRAAIITETGDDTDRTVASLAVFNPSGVFFDQDVPFNSGDPTLTGPLQRGHSSCKHGERAYPGGTWHWPEAAK
jgi:hypothetical protein